MDARVAIQIETNLVRANLLCYTERAFRRLPKVDRPRILDIGCGSGVATVALAQISGGDVVAIDIEPPLLEQLKVRAAKAGLADRILALQCSVFNLAFPSRSFDIIWSEGSIYTLGFQKGLTDWRRFLEPGGCLVVHDDIGDLAAKTAAVTSCGYQLLESFTINKADYWAACYEPLERWLQQAPAASTRDPELSQEIDLLYREMEIFKQIPGRDASVFFVMQRKD